MSETNLVRPSRDGDQFHYVWAARRCLLLLSSETNLKAVTIEGPSLLENAIGDGISTGEELIDVGEYYGSESLESATQVRYIQVKHSTVRVEEAWTPSGLEKTLTGFAARYKEVQQHLSEGDLHGKLEFWFVSNRLISVHFLEAVHDAAEGLPARHKGDLQKLERFTGLSGTGLTAFCKLLRLEGGQDGLWDQRNVLAQDVSCYLVDADVDGPIQLKELVTKKALSESAHNPAITRMDVLRALKTDESRLFPAPCLIQDIEKLVPREQEPELLRTIVQTSGIPIIVHADGGVGKSIFATRIKTGLPTGSASVLYDCFGDGQYRSASGYRHRHKDGLVQIANELASRGLCHPLIPSPHAEPSAYVRAFLYRLKQSITSLKSRNDQALLCIVVDAADNAQTAAEEIGEARSFVRDLIRERLPEGVRFVFLCRTHRQQFLDPPPETLRLKLNPFSRSETAVYLRQFFVDASEQDVDEFHRLSSNNPRVQALALSRQLPLSETLRALGPNPTTVDDTIGNLLEASVAKLHDAAGSVEKTQIDSICAGLAALRPLIPLSVLASMSGVKEAAIKSFAFDLGRPLLITGDTIQFFDEPAETWFRERFKPTASELTSFIASLKPLAVRSAYVASALPQLMLEAGNLAELVTLALSSEALPETSPIERRDVELQRLQFALKASLRAKRNTDAAKLALKAGGESAGDDRQRKLLQTNTDLAAVFMDSDRIQEIVSRRTFGSGWVGSHHAYEAGLLSGRSDLLGDARSRLRMAREWLRNWSRLPNEEREREDLSDDDILEMSIAFFNIHGADACAGDLRSWRPREVSFRVGCILASRFIDHGRYDDLNHLAAAAGNDVGLIIAITRELREVHRNPPKNVVERALRLALSPRIELKNGDRWDSEGTALRAVTTLVEAAHRLSIGTNESLAELLTRYLPSSPPRGLSSRYGGLRFPFLRAYTLRAALMGHSLDLLDLADDELRKELKAANPHSESRNVREFKEDIGTLLPWHLLWARIFVGHVPPDGLAKAIEETQNSSANAVRSLYREESSTSDEIATIWFGSLLAVPNVDAQLIDAFNQWITNLKQPLFITTRTHLARLAARSAGLEAHALNYASIAFSMIREARENAESKSNSFVELARAVLVASQSEATAYFNQAVEVASKIGDENLERWDAFLDLADRAASPMNPNPAMAYRLARSAELIYDYVDRDKHFDWTATVEAISGLCPSSSFAIISRWRDRDFGRAERILPIAVKFLSARGKLDANLALALICFRADWDEPLLLKNALDVCATKAEKYSATQFTYRYMTLGQHGVGTWRELKIVLTTHGLSLPEIDERIALGAREEESRKSAANNSSYLDNLPTPKQKNGRDWNAIFEGIDLSVANDIARAHHRLKDLDPPYYYEEFFVEAFRHVKAGKEAEFVEATGNVADFDLYHLRSFVDSFPEDLKSRLAVKAALAKTFKIFCRRFCMAITKSRYYEWFPLKTACELSGCSENELTDAVLTAIGEADEIAGASRLFTLVGLLTTKLTNSEALEALSFGLDLLDPVLEDEDGDGPWVPKLEPPSDIEGSLAGYVWACLAAPRANLRWEAAHVVRTMCTFGHRKALDHLTLYANGTSADAFFDSRLHFYKLHALQWLLIGLSRGAKDRPDILVPHADFLIGLALGSDPHVLIRQFAKLVLLELLDAGQLNPKSDLRSRLAAVNISTFPAVESKSYRRPENDRSDSEQDDDLELKGDEFYFGIDMGPYWFAPLARCFAKSQTTIEREALRVIRNDWKLVGTNRWDEDERHKRKIYRDGETRHSHGSHPPTDELSFYLSYHAMMIVAGKLLASTPVHHDPDDSDDDFSSWLREHGLSRQDNRWLADRRDPEPLERSKWQDEKEADEWRWTTTRNDFDRVLLTSDGRMNLWGDWTKVSGRREESIHVVSALVSPDRSGALLRALHSARDPHDYRIPDADDDMQIDVDGFQLKGWVIDRSGVSGLDEYDPWAADIKYPSPRLAPYITEFMKLNSDVEHRTWFGEADGVEVAWSQCWGHNHEKNDSESNHESGTRLQAGAVFMSSLLRELKMDLIVKVEIVRRRRRPNWERNNDDDFGFVLPSARLFLLGPDGNISSL